VVEIATDRRAFTPFWWLKPVSGKPVKTGCRFFGVLDHVLKHVARLKQKDKDITPEGVTHALSPTTAAARSENHPVRTIL
jgi:hypothetical protein